MRGLRLSLDPNHVPPHCVSLPDNVLPEVQPELFFGLFNVAARDQVGVHALDLVYVFVQVPECALLEAVGRGNLLLDISRLEVLLQNLVILFQRLCETRPIKLRKALELAQRHKQRDGAFLERDTLVVERAERAIAVVGLAGGRVPSPDGKVAGGVRVLGAPHAGTQQAAGLGSRSGSLAVVIVVIRIIPVLFALLVASPTRQQVNARGFLTLVFGIKVRVGAIVVIFVLGQLQDLIQEFGLLFGVEARDLFELRIEMLAEDAVGVDISGDEGGSFGVLSRAGLRLDKFLFELVDSGGVSCGVAGVEGTHSFLRFEYAM